MTLFSPFWIWTRTAPNPTGLASAMIRVSSAFWSKYPSVSAFEISSLEFWNAFSSFCVQINGTFCLVNFLRGSGLVAKSWMNQLLLFTRPKNDQTSDVHIGIVAFCTALTFASVGPTPFSERKKPMNVSLFMRYTHFSMFSVRPFSQSFFSTF